jgi:small ligand-binding sensory domain FIST
MKWASVVSENVALEQAFQEAAVEIRSGLRGESPHLTVAFVSAEHSDEFARVPDLFRQYVGDGLLLGCSAGGVIGGGHEVEQRAGVSLTAAWMPGVEVTPFHVLGEALPEPGAPAQAWETLLQVPAQPRPSFLLMPDPFSLDTEQVLPEMDRIYPGSCKVGGLASGVHGPGQTALFVGDTMHRSGMVGAALSGNIQVNTLVAQGCRPIGEPMFVTRCQDNRIFELDGKPPRETMQGLYHILDEADRKLFLGSLFLGVVMREHQDRYAQGDFLIRNLLGVDADTGALAVGTDLHENMVVQFQLRDARTSAEDLAELLGGFRRSRQAGQTEGALLFSCLGRGKNLYGHPDHDTDLFRQELGPVPLGGFFCNGEIGPVQGKTFVHGYTSSFGLFSSPEPDSPARKPGTDS